MDVDLAVEELCVANEHVAAMVVPHGVVCRPEPSYSSIATAASKMQGLCNDFEHRVLFLCVIDCIVISRQSVFCLYI